MKSTRMRRVTLSIALVSALAGVAACSSGSGKDDKAADKGTTRVSPIAALQSAEKSTDGADTAKIESTTSLGTLMSMKSDGVMGWSDGLTGDMTITYTGGTLAETMRKTGSTSMQARYLSDAYYAKMGEAFAKQMGGKHWVRYAYDDLAKLAGGSGAFLKDQMQNSSPNQSVKLLLASGDVKKVGDETVRGEKTTHYAGTVNVSDLAAKSSRLTASQLADLKKQFTQAGITTEDVDIWVNGKDLLVKAVSKGELSSGTMSSTTYYSDYGVKVSAVAPPASDTADFKDLLKAQGLTPGSSDTSSGSGTTS
ncbi:hypothetical protein OOK36_25580 [Streptomyces sp. NBC_00365]|uniref:hypothetical protein n=1 Tax=Streptomyces sp. NBC_00365 TaxID=2975726 RepID=UPI00225A7212|nr:hypothetical protein [Streptomyces sp. NBC_00365]MCX5092181.1 hypothetical protein [Streptomyces sp. NBC_00365]